MRSEPEGVYVPVGSVVAGKYVVERVLGMGGMAFVVSARHLELGERFALKFLGAQYRSSPVLVERFLREARAACRIQSEHVVRVFDVGTHEGSPYLVMEQLQGQDLAGVAQAAGGRLAPAAAVELAIQACEGLAAAHAIGIVHRDVKPENVFVVDHGGLPHVKILDFGISKVTLGDEEEARLTGASPLGTPAFMAPEQIRSTASVDARSDVWALGVVLYEMLTGAEGFSGANVSEVCAAVLEQEPRPLRELAPEVPEGLASVVARCLRKDPEERFGSVAELAAALLPYAPERSLASVERTSMRLGARVPTWRASGGAPPALEPLPRTSRPGLRIAAFFGVVALAVTVFAAPALLHRTFEARAAQAFVVVPPVVVTDEPTTTSSPAATAPTPAPPPTGGGAEDASVTVRAKRASIPVAGLPQARIHTAASTSAHVGAPPAPRPVASERAEVAAAGTATASAAAASVPAARVELGY